MENTCLNQVFHKWKLPLFFEFSFPKKDIYVNKGTLRMFDIFY